MSVFCVIIGLLLSDLTAVSYAETQYHFEKEIPIGGDGGWDYLTVDSVGRRLYVSHATKIVVVDIDKDTIAGEILDTPGVHGIAVSPDLGYGFSSNGQENKASIVELKSLRTISKVETGQNPDAMLYEPRSKEVYMFNGRGQSATVFDAKTGKVLATIPLGGKPEFATIDPEAGVIYNNIEDKNELVTIETKSHRVVNRWSIAPGTEASGMAIDLAHHRLFLGCGNQKMVMVNSTTGKVVSEVPIGKGVDANAFDPETQLAFASCGDGTVTIAHEDSPEKLTVVQTLKTEPRAKTMALDLKTHRIFLASARFESIVAQPGSRQRPKAVPGSFKILVYALMKP
jgi:YVTN family beta-propeller protein